MARILIENGQTVISPEEAMKWYCWHELVRAMEKHGRLLDKAVYTVERNVPDWEMRVLKKFLELSENDLIIT